MKVNIEIDGKSYSVNEGLSIRKAALKNGIYIPGICGHPDLPPVRDFKPIEKVYQGSDIIVGDHGGEDQGVPRSRRIPQLHRRQRQGQGQDQPDRG